MSALVILNLIQELPEMLKPVQHDVVLTKMEKK